MRLLTILTILLAFAACQAEQQNESKIITEQVEVVNPNGDSELALLMRAMFDHSMEMKKAIKAGQPIEVKHDFVEILTAQATEPAKAASETFQTLGKAYVDIMREMETAAPEEAAELYEVMVGNCMACHTALCPGPKVRIKKLIIEQ